MRQAYICVLLITAIAFWGCDDLVEDLDEDKAPKTESKLVVSCYISPQSPLISVLVSESQPLLGPATYGPEFIKNAEVILSSDVGQIKIPYRDSVDLYYIDSSAFKIVAGKTYTLSVSDGKRSVKATCTVPAKVPKIKNVNIEKVDTYQPHYLLLWIYAAWEDIKGENNYYQVRSYADMESIELVYNQTTGDSKLVPRKTRVELVIYPMINTLFSDANLDGTSFVGPKVGMTYMQRDTVVYRDKNNVEHSFDNESRISEIRMEVMNLDKNYYQFVRSTANSRDDSPFTEPTPVYSNVEGGLGLFRSI